MEFLSKTTRDAVYIPNFETRGLENKLASVFEGPKGDEEKRKTRGFHISGDEWRNGTGYLQGGHYSGVQPKENRCTSGSTCKVRDMEISDFFVRGHLHSLEDAFFECLKAAEEQRLAGL